MTTLAEHIIVAGFEIRPLVLKNSMYYSWASRIRLFIKGKKHDRMILDSIDNGPLVYLTVEENRQTRPKKYFKLTEAQQHQDDCDVQATNIILHGFLPDVIQPTLYNSSVIANEHAVIFVIDDEETLILEEESRSKMLDKQNDPILIEKKIKISPFDYSILNKIKEDFGKRFVTQKELSAEQAF
uniref:Integrase, catalytic region, zinc finger, CCHC-type, peptidase aspartic, catalytic n=1 Tax=Tanacetum cinerariifolium TaxID=118510 RepID=A0A699IGT1_TANCI|nr:hypothetical protein [Tanacetum cinerariifolium]